MIGHSFGGLVMKQVNANILSSCSCTNAALNLQAVIEAVGLQEYESFLEDLKGIIFLGTPHQGSSLSWFAKTVATLAYPLLSSKTSLVKFLQRNESQLSDLHGSYRSKVPSRVRELSFSFYETKETYFLGMSLGRVSYQLLTLVFLRICVDKFLLDRGQRIGQSCRQGHPNRQGSL